MKGQPGLGGVERVGQVADAALAEAEPLEDGEPGAVREGVEQPDGAIGGGTACEWP